MVPSLAAEEGEIPPEDSTMLEYWGVSVGDPVGGRFAPTGGRPDGFSAGVRWLVRL
jgi:hypothetical protein